MRPTCILFVFVSAVLSMPANAQQLFNIGVKGGVNQDDLSSSYPHSPLLGGHVGVFARLKPPVLPGVQGEVLFSSMGTSTSISGEEVVLRSAAIQLPLFAIFSLGPVELHAGGYYEHQLATEWDTDLDIQFDDEAVDVDDLRDGTFGALVGAGVRLGHFHAGGRYNFGLQPVGSGPYLSDVKNRQVQLYLGWAFLN